MKLNTLVLLSLVLLISVRGLAQVPRTLSYQGVLTDSLGNPKPDGTYTLTFRLYDVSGGGNAIWEEQKSLQLKKGLFHTVLGDQAVMGPSVKFDKRYWLGVQVASEPEMTPRVPLTSVGYSLHAAKADTAQYALAAPGVTLLDSARIAGTIADSSITSSKIHLPLTFNLWGPPYTQPDTAITINSTTRPNAIGINAGTTYGTAIKASADYYGTALYAEAHNWGTAIYADASFGPDNSGVGIIAKGRHGIDASGFEYGLVAGSSSVGISASASTGAGGGYGYGIGVATHGDRYGIVASCDTVDKSHTFYAGEFIGPVQVDGTLTKAAGAFKIDHPLDPANKYLQHSFVESPDMKNIYDGVVVLDGKGEATILLPAYFQALNTDFRYQLTCIGSYAPVYVAEEVANNSFRIAGGKPGQKISWQITGNRQDAYARAHRIQAEVAKGPGEAGRFLFPVEHGVSVEAGINYEMMKKMEAGAIEASKGLVDRRVKEK